MESIKTCFQRCFPNLSDYIYLQKLKRQNNKTIKSNQSLDESEYPDFLCREYKQKTGHELNLQDPRRLTEKIQWRKLYDRDIVYSVLSDKYNVRKWVEERIGPEYLIPLLGTWKHFNEIDFHSLPDQFVLKTNNASHTNMVVTDKKMFMKRKWSAGKTFQYWLTTPFSYLEGLELHYCTINPIIIAEQYIQPETGKRELSDYKFHCFDGTPFLCQVISDRLHGETIDFYDSEWKHIPIERVPYPNASNSSEKPINYDCMIQLASELSKGFRYVRVDLYNRAGTIYFGEMTFTPGSGYMVFAPDEWDYRMGDLWDIHSAQIDRESIKLKS